MRAGVLDVLNRIAERALAEEGVSTVGNAFVSLTNTARMKQFLALLAKSATQKKLQAFIRTIMKAIHAWDASALSTAVAGCSSDTQLALAPFLASTPTAASSAASGSSTSLARPASSKSVTSLESGAATSSKPIATSSKAPVESTRAKPTGPAPAKDAVAKPPSVKSELDVAVLQLSAASASVSERSACLSVIASLLSSGKPIASPMVGTTPESPSLRAEAEASHVIALLSAICACLATDQASLK